jgi:hypothetical protein
VIEIELSPKRCQWCLTLAAVRNRTAERDGYRPRNGAPIGPVESQKQHNLGALCECAWMLMSQPTNWNLHTPSLPDFDGWIDVKGIRRRTDRLILKPGDNLSLAYVVVCAERYPVMEILCWTYGYDAIPFGTKETYRENGEAVYVPLHKDCMRRPWELLIEKAARDAEGKGFAWPRHVTPPRTSKPVRTSAPATDAELPLGDHRPVARRYVKRFGRSLPRGG